MPLEKDSENVETGLSDDEFEMFFAEISEFSESERDTRIEQLGLTKNQFRQLALKIFGPAMPSPEWLSEKVAGTSTESARSVLASFGLFADFEAGDGAVDEDSENLVYEIEAVELRAGEAVVLKYWTQYVEPEPEVVESATTTQQDSSASVNFDVEYYPQGGSLVYVDTVRGQELFLVPKTPGKPEWIFSLSVVTSPATNARCVIKTSATGFGPSSGDFGWEVRTNESGRATLYSFPILWDSVLRPLPSTMTPLWVRCFRGEQYVDSPLFAVTKGG